MMTSRSIRALLAVTAVAVSFSLAAPAASASTYFDSMQKIPSPRWIMLELRFGPYMPNVDSEFDGATPFADVYGDSSFLLSGLQVEFEFLKDFGTLAAGVGWSFGTTDGKSLLADGGASSEGSDFYIMPMNVSLSYHLDIFAQKWSVPFVPYVRGGIDYVLWWSTDGLGDVSDWASSPGASTDSALGGVWGWHVSGGLKLLLDVFAPGMARTFDMEIGVNNTYLFAEFMYLRADDFGAGDSLRLGDSTYMFGIAFEM